MRRHSYEGKDNSLIAFLAKKRSIIASQEVHGNDVVARLQCTGVLRSHMLITSHAFAGNGIIKGDTGGVGFSISRELYVNGNDGSPSSLATLSPQLAQTFLVISIPGRAISIEICDSKGETCVFSAQCAQL